MPMVFGDRWAVCGFGQLARHLERGYLTWHRRSRATHLKHVEKDSPIPAPQARRIEPEDRARGAPRVSEKRTSYVGAAIAVFVLVGGLGWGLSSMFGARHNDQVSDQERTQRASAFAQVKQFALPAVKEGEWSAALDSMRLSPKDRAELLKDVIIPGTAPAAAAAPAQTRRSARTAPQKLVWITLWDTHAQDGDVVMIQSGAYQQEVTLLNKPMRLAVPLPPSGVVNLTGVHDGGGGITLGALSGEARVALPVMSEGQTLGIPVTLQ